MINIGVVAACIEGFSRAGVSRWGHTFLENIGMPPCHFPFFQQLTIKINIITCYNNLLKFYINVITIKSK